MPSNKTYKHPQTIEDLMRDYGHMVERYRETLGDDYDDFAQTVWLDAMTRVVEGSEAVPCKALSKSTMFAKYDPTVRCWSPYFKQYLKWAYLDWKRDRTRNREVEDADLFDVSDPASLVPHDAFVSYDYLQALVSHLDGKFANQIGRGVVPLYFELAADGISDAQMIEAKMLPLTQYSSSTGWNNFKTRWLYPAVQDYLQKNP